MAVGNGTSYEVTRTGTESDQQPASTGSHRLSAFGPNSSITRTIQSLRASTSTAPPVEEVPSFRRPSVNRIASSHRVSHWEGQLSKEREHFAEVRLSEDDLESNIEEKWSYSRKLARWIITKPAFDAFIATIVVVNSITMGLESEVSAAKFFLVTDVIFLVIYSAELILRFHVQRLKLFHHFANILDTVIVLGGWASAMTEILDESMDGMKLITTLKVLRAFRSIRLLRMFTFFEGCWIVAASFSSCLIPLFWTCTFLVIILFAFTMFAVELIGDNNTFNGLEQKDLFYPTHKAFFSLFQVTTFDEWRSIVQPLCDRSWWVYFFFLAYICITAMSLMNLVTATVVDSSLARTLNEADFARIREQRQRERECRGIEEFMELIEHDGDENWKPESTLSSKGKSRKSSVAVSTWERDPDREELGECLLSPGQSAHKILEAKATWSGVEKIFDAFGITEIEDVEHVMRCLDEDGDGMLSSTELLDGILDLRHITEDNYRVALIQACNSESSRCNTLERCIAQLRAPEECVDTLKHLDAELSANAEIEKRRKSRSLAENVEYEIAMLQDEMDEQRWKLALQRSSMDELRKAVKQLQASWNQSLPRRAAAVSPNGQRGSQVSSQPSKKEIVRTRRGPSLDGDLLRTSPDREGLRFLDSG